MEEKTSTINVLLTCHNRRDKTIKCLEALFGQEGLDSAFRLNVYLVDDNSTDGTTEAVRELSESITIIKGNGNLFWNRGMILAWKTAEADRPCDYFLWLNDDTFLYPSAIAEMLAACTDDNTIIAGSTCSAVTGEITYGGFNKATDALLVPTGWVQPCDFFCGNCVLIPYRVFSKVGFLSASFHHAIGDFDYGLRAIKKGIKSFISPNYIGTCEVGKEPSVFFDPAVSLSARMNSLYKSSCMCNPYQKFVFENRHRGFFIALFHFFTIHLRAAVPSVEKIKPSAKH